MLLQLLLCLPLNEKQRDMVRQRVLERCYKLYPENITHELSKAQREKREKEGLYVSQTTHEWQDLMNTSFTVPFD